MTVIRHFLDSKTLDTKQKDVIIGSLLGDASLGLSNHASKEWLFSKRQSHFDIAGVSKADYVNFHFDILNPFSRVIYCGAMRKSKNAPTLKKESYSFFVFCAHPHNVFSDLAKKWYKNDGNGIWDKKDNRIIKQVPNDIVLTSLSLCIWMMDDGFCYPKDANAILCTHGFTREEVVFLVERLNIDLGIQSKMREVNQEWKGIKTKKPVIYIGRKSYFDTLEMIKPHVTWDCFKYKLDTTTYNKKPHRGETHSLAKLNEEKVQLAFKLREQGMLHEEIAKEVNVSKAAISLVLSGDRWKHLNLKTEVIRKPRIDNDIIRSQIIEMKNQGKTQSEIADCFNTSQATISRILMRYYAAN